MIMAALSFANTSKTIFGRQALALLPKASSSFIIVQNRDASDLATTKRGTGGRSSFSGIVATVFGATGFVGKYVVNKLGKIGSQVIIPYRCTAYEVEPLRMTGDLGQILFFPYEYIDDEEAIRKSIQFSNVVINLIGRDYETNWFPYSEVHVETARRLARISKECGVEKFIHMSHLLANKDIQKVYPYKWSRKKKTSTWLQSKYESELAVREEFPEAIIFKASDIHGDEDRFIKVLMKPNRQLGLPYVNKRYFGDKKMGVWEKGEMTIKQPVYVSDVAAGIVAAIRNPEMAGKNIDCVGPERYFLSDIIDYMNAVLARRTTRSHLTPFDVLKSAVNVWHPMGPTYDKQTFIREALTDEVNPHNPTLEDLGVQLTNFPDRLFHQLYRMSRSYGDDFYTRPESPLPAEHHIKKPKVLF